MTTERVPQEFLIPTSELDAGGREYSFPLRAPWVRGVFEAHEATTSGKDGRVEVRASKSQGDVIVHGTLEADLVVPCARCLEPTQIALQSELSVLYVPASQLKGKEGEDEELAGEDADTLPFSGETVVLDDLIRDELLLGVPMIPLCREDCPGMAPAPNQEGEGKGEDAKPIDPRLAPLLAFSARKRENK